MLCRSLHCATGIDPVIAPEVVKSNIVHWVEPGLLYGFVDGMSTAIDRLVLELHDRTSPKCVIALEITSKSGDRRHHDEYHIPLPIPGCPQDALNDGGTNLVLDWFLLITASSDEKLILNVDEVLAVADDLAVCVLDGVLLQLDDIRKKTQCFLPSQQPDGHSIA